MSDDFELVRGSGNVFRDFDMPNPDLEQLRAILAAQIIKALDRKRLTVRKAAELTGIAAADFSRIRNANIGRFTVDQMRRAAPSPFETALRASSGRGLIPSLDDHDR